MNSNVIIHTECKQDSEEWRRLRLGKITSSCIGKIMHKGKNAEFSKTGFAYLLGVAAERNMAEWVEEDNITLWIERTSLSAVSLTYGKENESYARKRYEEIQGVMVSQIAFVERADMPEYGDSPDGVVYGENELGVIEIKCPYNPATHMLFCQIDTAEKLKELVPDYYWQCYSHVVAIDADWCDFISFDMYQKNDIHIIRIYPDEATTKELMERVNKGNEEINKVILKQ